MTEMLARDGEGATKLIRVQVVEAANEADAKRVARALVESPLIKTMAFGADPNVGRILMAVGKCVDCSVEPNRLTASIGGVTLIEAGVPLEFDDSLARASLAGDPVEFRINLGLGTAAATAWGCDLTEGYVAENAAYVSS
jgi:glutamate N-acetyltransferase/amino-acid N-acetyltransferase